MSTKAHISGGGDTSPHAAHEQLDRRRGASTSFMTSQYELDDAPAAAAFKLAKSGAEAYEIDENEIVADEQPLLPAHFDAELGRVKCEDTVGDDAPLGKARSRSFSGRSRIKWSLADVVPLSMRWWNDSNRGRGARNRRRCSPCRRTVVFALPLLLAAWALLWILCKPPGYILLPPDVYHSTLQHFSTEHLGAGADHAAQWKVRLWEHLDAGSRAPQGAGRSATGGEAASAAAPMSLVPTTIFSTDRTPAPPGWAGQWSALGFAPVTFLDDPQEDTWLADHFNSSTTAALPSKTMQAWTSLPRGVMRADFLRYLLLLAEGGTWSDMDVEPLSQVRKWVEPPGRVLASEKAGAGSSLPVRLIVGVECDPISYKRVSVRAWLELLRILPMNRHREVQFVQWTLHSAAGHPVMADVLRRMLHSHDIFEGYKQDLLREAYRVDALASGDVQAGSAATAAARNTSAAGDAALQKLALAQRKKHPWTDRSMVLRVRDGLPRLSWHPLSVEEWTGPAVFTDAVMSYLNAVAGVTGSDLLDLAAPVQVEDVLVVPVDRFNPSGGRTDNSRVVHHYRGSWKHGADKPYAKPT